MYRDRLSAWDVRLILLNILIASLTLLIATRLDMLFAIGLVLLAILCLAFVVLTLDKPRIALILTFCGNVLGPYGMLMPEAAVPLSVFQLTLMYAFFVYFLSRLNRGDLAVTIHHQYWWVIAFGAFMFLTGVYSHDRAGAFFHATMFIPLVLLSCMIIEQVDKPQFFRWVFELTVVISAGFSLVSIWGYQSDSEAALFSVLSGHADVFNVFGRQEGVYYDPNHYGLILVFPIIYLIVTLFITRERLSRVSATDIYHLLMLGIILAALLTTYSRSSWLGLFCAIVAAFFLARKGRRLILLSAPCLAFLTILALKSLFIQSVLLRVASVTDLSLNVSNTTRILLARAGLEMFTDSYTLGNGYYSFRALAPAYIDYTKTFGVLAPHNISIELLADMGILGFALFYGMFFAFFSVGVRTVRSEGVSRDIQTYALSFTAYLIAMLIFYQLYPGFINNNYLWLSFGSLIALQKVFSSAKES